MGLFDVFKNKQAQTESPYAESVEEIVQEVVTEIHDETGEDIPQQIVEEVVDTVKGIEESVEDALKDPSAAKEFSDAEEKAEEQPAEVVQEMPKAEKSKGFFEKLKEGLNKTRNNIVGGIDGVLGAFTSIDEDLFDELEEALIMADLGVDTSVTVVENLRQRVKRQRVTDPQEIKNLLVEEIKEILTSDEEEDALLPSPAVLLVIGVNGVGKTTTIGKLAHIYKSQGRSVMLAAADTFRAAAIDQLEIWGSRSDIPVIKHAENSDPAAVVFDAAHAAKNRKTDLLICDTAGRLHNKKNLMEELKKIERVIVREYPEAKKEVYLVLDATTGQNALQQAKLFKEVADITGIVLTKLDGTAKGGIVIAIKHELGIPVRYIGVGEGIEDLQQFDPGSFAEALFRL